MTRWLPVYLVALVTCAALDFLWLGVVANGFYQRQMGHLMRPDVQYGPAALFYLLYVAALLTFVVAPAAHRGSATRAWALGAFFGLTAYAAYDLTSLAVMRDFPVVAGVVDMAWGATVSAVVCRVGYAVARRGAT
ncbi:MAG TPA: DUF2177 family protein [Gemmatimonadaceae bacterium]|nr:DUF2177 family protein [Gemmatimonadaceae bacterium]